MSRTGMGRDVEKTVWPVEPHWRRIVSCRDSICSARQQDQCTRNEPVTQHYGWQIGNLVMAGQWWVPVLWDGDEDPDFCKAACVQYAAMDTARGGGK